MKLSENNDVIQSEDWFMAWHEANCISTSIRVSFLTHVSLIVMQVHWAYVDCVRWLGDLVLSKSVHNKLYLWEPDLSTKQSQQKGYVKCHQVSTEGSVCFLSDVFKASLSAAAQPTAF